MLFLSSLSGRGPADEAAARIQRVFTCDPGMGIVRHADAGYEDAQQFAADHDVDLGG